MKIFYIALFVICLFSASVNAQQPFAPAGASWHYDFTGLVDFGFTRIDCDSDTTINNILCKKLQPVKYVFQFPGSSFHTIQYLEPQYIYQNGDTVFYYFNNKFFTLFNFGAAPGDEWQIADSITFQHCDTNSFLHVDSIGTALINGQNLRWISVHPTGYSSYGYNCKILERVGPIDSSYLFPQYLNCDTQIIAEIPINIFHCYQDDLFSLYNSQTEVCEYLLYLGINSEDDFKSQMNLFPNPCFEKISLSFQSSSKEDGHLKILNATGTVILQHPIKLMDQQLDLSDFSSGIYIIQIQIGDNLFTNKFVKLE